jgi:hypothetical protein
MPLLPRRIRSAFLAISGLAVLIFAIAELVSQPRVAGDPRELRFLAVLGIATAGLAFSIRKLLDARGRFTTRAILITVLLAVSWSWILRWMFLLKF